MDFSVFPAQHLQITGTAASLANLVVIKEKWYRNKETLWCKWLIFSGVRYSMISKMANSTIKRSQGTQFEKITPHIHSDSFWQDIKCWHSFFAYSCCVCIYGGCRIFFYSLFWQLRRRVGLISLHSCVCLIFVSITFFKYLLLCVVFPSL